MSAIDKLLDPWGFAQCLCGAPIDADLDECEDCRLERGWREFAMVLWDMGAEFWHPPDPETWEWDEETEVLQ